MKVLHTVGRYHPDVGGSEEVVRRLSEILAAKGHTVTVATSVTTAPRPPVMNGVRVMEFGVAGDASTGYRGDVASFRQFVRDEEFDVVMNYGANVWPSDLTVELLPELGAVSVFVPLGYFLRNDARYAGYYANLSATLASYDAVVALSHHTPDWDLTRQHGHRRTVVIPNGADPGDFDAVPKGSYRMKTGVGDAPLVIAVSNHSQVKRHGLFWDVADLLKRSETVFHLIGNPYVPGPTRWLRQCYASCRLRGTGPRRKVLEGLPRRDVLAAFVDADAVLLTSAFETAPVVMTEAFASRSLFVSTPVGNVPEYSDIACVATTAEEMSSVLERYRSDRSAFRGRLDAGRQFIDRQLNWTAITGRYEELYMSLLSERRTR